MDDYRAYAVRAAIYDEEDFSAVIAVPLIQRGQVVGVLDVLDDAERRAFTDDDLWLLELFAAQAAQAIENARTYVELERAYRKQRELDRMKDDFIATASHELRTPLTGVQGFLDLLLEFPGSRDEPLAHDFLQQASDSAQELAEISERLLQTSRLDTGRMELHLGRCGWRRWSRRCCARSAGCAASAGRRTNWSPMLDAAERLRALADLGRLKEVLDNLVSNAIKYSPQGGRITVSCEPFGDFTATLRARKRWTPRARRSPPSTIAAITERPTVSCRCSRPIRRGVAHAAAPAVLVAAQTQPYYRADRSRDEGMGIPESEQGRLFGRFARLDEARASQIRGTGLGLYICRQIARAMDGDVWLQESEPGSGSVFAVALPAAPDSLSRP